MVNEKTAELRHWHARCLTMSMKKPSRLHRLGRLFVIRTRFEAWAVTWAIALGAVERGKHYLALYPGALGWTFFLICTGVVFVAGAKLLDATRLAQLAATLAPVSQRRPRRHRSLKGSRPQGYRPLAGSRSRPSQRVD